MSSKKTNRRPISIDNDDIIDFSSVTNSTETNKHLPPTILLQNILTNSSQQNNNNNNNNNEESNLNAQAVDARLNSYTHRAAPRRRIGFGNIINNTTKTITLNNNNNNNNNNIIIKSETDDNNSKDLIDAFWREDAARKEEESKEVKCENFERSVRALWDENERKDNNNNNNKTSEPITYSLIHQFFSDGVPDVEPWDMWALTMPRYSSVNIIYNNNNNNNNNNISLDRVHHPILGETHYSQHYQHHAEKTPVIIKIIKTKEELRAERREKLKKEKEERDRAKRIAQQQQQLQLQQEVNSDGVLINTTKVKDRLTNNNLRYNLFNDSVLNPLGTENKIYLQYQERFIEHQRRNHERHVSAIPNQIQKRENDRRRHARENPVLRAYYIFPIFSPIHLGKLRNYANDNLLHGFILWVHHCAAIIVFTGGEVAVRHLERWILNKMKWEYSNTKATRLFSCPLQDVKSFSFVSAKSRKRARETMKEENNNNNKEKELDGEHVYMNFVETLEEGEIFMKSVPTEGPWRDLTHIWRAALSINCKK